MTKVAISIPEELLSELEREQERTGKSRSALIRVAVESWLRQRGTSAADQRYVSAYLAHPEASADRAAVAAEAVAHWEPWE